MGWDLRRNKVVAPPRLEVQLVLLVDLDLRITRVVVLLRLEVQLVLLVDLDLVSE